MEKLTHEHLLRRLSYDPETGIFIRKERPATEFSSKRAWKSWNTRFKGKVAGGKDSNGYIRFRMDHKRYFAHRLAWFYIYGYSPENFIDHKDRDPSNNKIDNLREASNQCNQRNAGMFSTNTSGVKGVYYEKEREIWRASIKINQKTSSLGSFKIFNDAVKARWEAEVKYKFPNCCTSSSSYNYLKDNCLL